MLYRDREGRIFEGGTSQDIFLRKMYATERGRRLLKLMSASWVSRFVGSLMNTRLSALFVDSFIRNNHIKLREYVPCRYKSYNDCFTRKIKKSARPINPSEQVLISPADGKVTAYKIDSNSVFEIKNSHYTVESLLRDADLAKEYEGGYCLIVRLAVDNYHRYSYAVSGHKNDNCYIMGGFNTVNPIALEHIKVYAENCREYTVIDSEVFGKVVQMEVGALCVGKIKNHEGEAKVVRGTEKGYFEFGGSSIVLLLKKDAAVIDEDILKNTKDGCETKVLMGERIAVSTK